MSEQVVYGYPCVEDPHDFHPDVECCSPAEIEAHRRACETYGTPEYEPNKGCYTEYDAEGRIVKRVVRTSWGIGANIIREPEPEPDCTGCDCPREQHHLLTGACLTLGCECGGFQDARLR